MSFDNWVCAVFFPRTVLTLESCPDGVELIYRRFHEGRIICQDACLKVSGAGTLHADADVYGPSIPKMTGTEDEIPEVEVYDAMGHALPAEAEIPDDGREIIVPVEKYEVKWMSIGYFARPEQTLIWRGPMACNALKQMLLQVKWGELDYLLIDLPPGTGDIHISLVHDIPLSGAVIVTTPQAVALSDVEKGVNLFRNPQIDKPILGIIENMSWFTPAELPDSRYYIFGRDGGQRMADKYGLTLLGQIPLVQSVREGGDERHPAALEDGPVFEAMKTAVSTLVDG